MSTGQLFVVYNTYDGDIKPKVYILAQVDCSMVALISLKDGNRWHDPVRVEDTDNITPYEWEKITGDSIKKIHRLPPFGV